MADKIEVMENGDLSNQVVGYTWLIEKGYSDDVALALVGREVTYGQLKWMSPFEVFEHFLEWNGIIGYTSTIRNALDNIRNMEAL